MHNCIVAIFLWMTFCVDDFLYSKKMFNCCKASYVSLKNMYEFQWSIVAFSLLICNFLIHYCKTSLISFFSFWLASVHVYITIHYHRMVHSGKLPSDMVVTAKYFEPTIANLAYILCSTHFTSILSAPPDISIEALV